MDLFMAPVLRSECNPKAHIRRHLSQEARGCTYLVLWLDCDRGENICYEVLPLLPKKANLSEISRRPPSKMASSSTYLRAVLLAVVLLVASPAATRAGRVCEGEKFPAGRSYATCADLPALGATLHWTYDGKASTLSVAFVAKPQAAGGWVSWSINPTGDGMKGSQALVALKGASSCVVNTYNVTGYKPFPAASTPIAFKASDLAADESATGKLRLYGKLQLPRGMETVNHIWQVGSTVTGGVPMKHAFAKENLDAKGRLSLTGGLVAQEPAPAPVAGGPSAEAENAVTAPSPSPSGKNSAATTTYTPAPVLVALALAGFLAFA